MKNVEGLDPLPYWCYIPRSQWTPYHHLMMWSRKYKMSNYRTLLVGKEIYLWLLKRVPVNRVTPKGVVLWADTEFHYEPELQPLQIVTGSLMG